LRAEPQDLITIDYVKYMVKRYDFFDSNWNISGSFQNDFADNGDETVTDRTTGLMWQRNGSSRTRSWRSAKSYVEELNSKNFAEYSDWRLPTIDELASLLKKKKTNGLHIDPIFGKVQTRAWSADYDEGRQEVQASVWIANFTNGRTVKARFCILPNCMPPYSTTNVNLPDNHVRAVRSLR
jgi:hypothetical protein